jgi:ribonuclease HI
MYFDGAFSLEGAGADVLLVSPTGDHLKYVVQLAFSREYPTNNMVEYEGLLAGLRIATGLGISRLVVWGVSQLVVNQINKAYNSPQMWAYVDEVRKLERRFNGLKLEHIPRGRNIIADKLSQIVAKRLPVPAGIFAEWLTKPLVAPKVVAHASKTSLWGSGPTTTTLQGSATPARDEDPKLDPIASLAKRATPLCAEELLQYLKF